MIVLASPLCRGEQGRDARTVQPAIWKSYTYASDGFGYYMEIDNFGGSPYLVRLGYVHRDGRVALSRMVCDGAGCNVNAWNGVPFPYDEAGGG